MKILLTGDTHLCSRGASRATKERLKIGALFLKDILNLQEKHNIELTIFAGDTTEAKDYFDETAEKLFLEKFDEITNVDYCRIRGNHERGYGYTLGKLKLTHGNFLNNICLLNYTKEEDFILCMLPYSPAKEFKQRAQLLLDLAKGVKARKKYLISHINLVEGLINGRHLPSVVTAEDLYPDYYDFVFLGDYHEAQVINDNIIYLGSGFPQTFSNVLSEHGVWLLDTKTNEAELLTLPSSYPKFIKVQITTQVFTRIKDYDPYDYYWITCPTHLLKEYRKCYPEARIDPVIEQVKPNNVRFNLDPKQTDSERAEKYIKYVNPKLEHTKLMEVFQEVQKIKEEADNEKN